WLETKLLTRQAVNAVASIGTYKLFRVLGEGPSGRVYEAFDTTSQRSVAVKMIHPELVRTPKLAERLRAHAISPPKLEHANINRLRDIYCTRDEIAIVMDKVVGETLDRFTARNGALSPREIVPDFLGVLDAFSVAHTRGFLHCDVK